MAYVYDDQNIFAKILRGEIPNTTVHETEHTLAFRDVAPQAPEHVLIIPKGAYVTYDHFASEASDAEIVDFTRAVADVCHALGVCPGSAGSGYRLVSNAGQDGNQEVPHMHVHVVAGRGLGGLLPQV
ncbi:HIT domain-containing protein [Nereida sp.]|uniref:HIT domain-containing protein n=1 Tax=Nereida sp. TaxID=2736090 RepID=UPI003F695FB0